MDPATKTVLTLSAVLAGMGISVSLPDFVGGMIVAALGAMVAAVFLPHEGWRDRLATMGAGLFLSLVVVIGHDSYLADMALPLKTAAAGLLGRLLVVLLYAVAQSVMGRSESIAASLMERFGLKGDGDD